MKKQLDSTSDPKTSNWANWQVIDLANYILIPHTVTDCQKSSVIRRYNWRAHQRAKTCGQ